jgi:hypothetical protein
VLENVPGPLLLYLDRKQLASDSGPGHLQNARNALTNCAG